MIQWSDVEDAIATWLAPDPEAPEAIPVDWQNQGGEYLGYPFYSLNILSLVPRGMAEIRKSYDAGQPAGEEIELVARQRLTLTLSLDVCTNEKNVRGQNSPMALAGRATTRLWLPPVRAALRAVGLGHFETGPIQDLTKLFIVNHEGRAKVDLGFHVAEHQAVYVGYFTRVSGTGTVSGRSVPFDTGVPTP
jgi:hypothetical protein